MHIGGVLLGAGMTLALEPDDYLGGDEPAVFTVHTIAFADADWVVLDGVCHPTAHRPWLGCRLHVRVDALKRSLC